MLRPAFTHPLMQYLLKKSFGAHPILAVIKCKTLTQYLTGSKM